MYLNLIQIAESFGVSESVVEDWIRNEGLPHTPDRGRLLFDRVQVANWAAADMLAQAEHGSGHERVWLVTNSPKILSAVEKEIARQMPKLARREFIQRALQNNSWLIQVDRKNAR